MHNIICLFVLRANKGTESLKLHQPRLIFVLTLSNAPSSSVTKITFLQFQETCHLIYAWTMLCYDHLLICTCLTFKLAIPIHFTYNTTTSLMHPTPGKLAQDGINDYNLQKATQENFHSIITFQAFSLLIIFIFLKFTLNPFNSHAHF